MTTATIQQDQQAPADAGREPALPLRSDTFLGVCEAVGQDLGIHANWLRIPFAALILWNPVAIISAYLGLGVVVAVTRWFFPRTERRSAAVAEAQPQEAVADRREELPIAA